MLTKQEFIAKLETEARSILTGKEYDDYRQAQIDDEYYHFDDGRKVTEFIEGMYPVYVDRLETKALDREFSDYRGKFMKVLTDESVNESLVVSYRSMKSHVPPAQFESYIRDEFKRYRTGDDRVLKFFNESTPISIPKETQIDRGLSHVMNDESESVLQYKDSDRYESVLQYKISPSLVDSLHSTICDSVDQEVLLASCSTDSKKTNYETEEGGTQPLSIYEGVNWDFGEFDGISPFSTSPIRNMSTLVDPSAKIPDEWLPNIKRERLTDGGVECYVKTGTEKCIRDAWNSPEWSTNPIRASRKAKSNLEKVIAVTKFIVDWQIRFGKCSVSTIRNACGGQDWGLDYIDLIQAPYSTGKLDDTGMIKMYYILKLDAGSVHVDPFLWNHDTKTEVVTCKSVITAYNFSCEHAWRMMAGSPLLNGQYTNWTQLTKPDLDAVREYIHGLVGCTHKGKAIVSESTVARPAKGTTEYKKAARNYCWVEEWVEIFEHYNTDTEPYFYGKHYDRIYGPYQQLPSCIRRLYKYNDKSLVWIDYSSMHPTLLMLKYIDDCKALNLPGFDTERDTILKILGVDRDLIAYPEHNPRKVLLTYANAAGLEITDAQMKRYQLTYFNEAICDMFKNPLHKVYKKLLPGFKEWLLNLKKVRDVIDVKTGKTRKTCGYRVVSRYLLNREATLMEDVIRKMWGAGIFAMLCHDGIDVEPGRLEEAMRIFTRVLIEQDLPVNLTVDK